MKRRRRRKRRKILYRGIPTILQYSGILRYTDFGTWEYMSDAQKISPSSMLEVSVITVCT